MPDVEEPRKVVTERKVATFSSTVVVAIVFSIVVPFSGWVLSLSARVAVLESRADTLSSAATQLAAMQQEILDFKKDFDDLKDDMKNKPGYTYRYPDDKQGPRVRDE
jgi:Tfp pilus assembly protein PilN